MADAFKVHDIRPFIGSKNFDLSRDFYVTLGWEVTYDAADLRVLKLGPHSFYLQNHFNKTWCHNTMLHVSVFNVDAWHTKVSALFNTKSLKHGRMSKTIENRDYGRTFFVWDPSGVLIHFTQFHD